MSIAHAFSAQIAESRLKPIETARRVATIVAAQAEAADGLHHLTDETVAAMKEAGLYRLLLPRSLGGIEADPITALQVIEELSRADGAAGWCLMVSALESGMAGAYLPKEATDVMFGASPDIVMAGQGIPRGRAVPSGGGYQFSGNFSYGSGIHHADYVHAGGLVFDGDRPHMLSDGSPEMRLFHVRRRDVAIADNWNVIGLRGTGSYDYSIAEIHVPIEFTYQLEERNPRRGGAMYTLGLVGLTALGHTGFALGVGRRALDEIATIAIAKENLFGRLADSAKFQEQYALAEANLDAARAYCFDKWGEVMRTLDRGNAASVKQVAQLRLALRHSHEVASQVTTFAHRASGGVSLRDCALQRCFRDVHAATQHILVSDRLTQDCGRALLGQIAQGAGWTMRGLSDGSFR
jgi:alkylation response protein AidB-like acyl-CoA dehydrogenase